MSYSQLNPYYANEILIYEQLTALLQLHFLIGSIDVFQKPSGQPAMDTLTFEGIKEVQELLLATEATVKVP